MKRTRRHIGVFIIALLALVAMAGCPRGIPGRPGRKADVIAELACRRMAMSVMEADIRIRFPEGLPLASSLEGHAAYKLDDGGPRLRMVAFAPMGLQAFDLLVRDGGFLVKLGAETQPLDHEALCLRYGDGVIARAASLLAKRPGIFFGGVPEGIGPAWNYTRSVAGAWLESPDGARYLIRGETPMVVEVVMGDGGEGILVAELDKYEDTKSAMIPTRVRIIFDKKTLFTFVLKSIDLGPELPDGLFDITPSIVN